MNRRALIASLITGSLLGTRSTLAAPLAAKHRLGIFFAGWSELAPAKDRDAAKQERDLYLKALAELDYVEGRNLAVDWRSFDMDFARAPQVARELVHLRPDVILTSGTPQTKVLLDATKTIPIVTSLSDPVASGLTHTLAHPEGNVTGLCITHPDTAGKEIELIRKLVPKLDRLVFVDDIRYSGARQLMAPFDAAARSAGVAYEVKIIERSELENIFIEMKRFGTAAAFIMFADIDFAETAKLALNYRVPTTYPDNDYVRAGGLMSFTMFHGRFIQRTASIIARMFEGLKPTQIPWELPDRSYLALNVSTARLLGLTVPSDLLVRADEVVN
jgi:putative ABC transport system substrate-binding protein